MSVGKRLGNRMVWVSVGGGYVLGGFDGCGDGLLLCVGVVEI